jgi:succinate-acetate transporter protein
VITLVADPRPGRRSQADTAFGTAHRKFANPSPFGFFCLATSIMTVALVNFGARGVAVTTFLAAPAIWVAGVGQLLAGECRSWVSAWLAMCGEVADRACVFALSR